MDHARPDSLDRLPEPGDDDAPAPTATSPAYRLVTRPGWPQPLALDAVDDEVALALGRRGAQHREDVSAASDWPAGHRVERSDGLGWRVLHAWVSRR